MDKYKKEILDILEKYQEEINQYKWIESEKRGYDIGDDAAFEEWSRLHFNNWKKYQWDNLIKQAVDTG